MNPARDRRLLTRRRALLLAGTAALGAVGVGGYTWWIEPHWVRLTQQAMPIAGLPDAWVGKTIVQLSDVHVGPQVSDRFLTRTLERVNDLKPDAVVLTGDLMTCVQLEEVNHTRAVLRTLNTDDRPAFVSFGNHDWGGWYNNPTAAGHLDAALTSEGFRVLRNRAETHDGLRFVGLDDYWSPAFDATLSKRLLDDPTPSVALSHNPDTADLPIWGRFRGWHLAGHTHGGQCRLPGWAPILPIENKRYVHGAFALSSERSMYVNQGLGHSLRVRFLARPEVTVFTLEQATS